MNFTEKENFEHFAMVYSRYKCSNMTGIKGTESEHFFLKTHPSSMNPRLAILPVEFKQLGIQCTYEEREGQGYVLRFPYAQDPQSIKRLETAVKTLQLEELKTNFEEGMKKLPQLDKAQQSNYLKSCFKQITAYAQKNDLHFANSHVEEVLKRQVTNKTPLGK